MFSSNNRSTQLTCGFKVNTNSPEWHKSMTRILKKIKGGDFLLDVDQGIAYISGEGDPNKLLKLMGSIKGKAAEMTFVKTGGRHHLHYPNLLHYNSNSYYGQPPSYNSYWPSDNCYSRQHPPYYSQSLAMQPYHHQYPYPGYSNYGYY
ncbi:hypothetical protein ISN44_As13g031620 [Arabidopsis suecica]|uniref:Metal ion binding protein n=1 Tax=Arabidopsis suecica TaxID=45249 RepID=A0A8T1XZF1_ARASU|nr:hypothetical protein ISN44_As13g031620 [Arabidopsis suecica]